MGQYDAADRAQAAVAAKLQAELALDAQVLLAKYRAFSGIVPGFGERALVEVIEPMVEEMVRSVREPAPEAEPAAVQGRGAEAAESPGIVHHLEPRRPVPPSYVQHPTSEIQACIVQTLEASGDPMRIDDLQTSLEDQRFSVTSSNLSVILHRMVRNGLIHRPMRGVYAALPADPAQVRRVRGE
ncbi:hypothetical protein [Prosthecomicrobium sp. N25]|uniref:hypothetical protein n=1 Tax=Prosthecomicrobium sp. N25 TaxID=3129254 RepID=UPI00307882AB